MDATICRVYTFNVSVGKRRGSTVGQRFSGGEVWSRTRRAVKRLTPCSPEGRLLAVLWALAALATLGVALAQSAGLLAR